MSRFVANFVFNGPPVSRWQEPARPAPRPEPAAAEVMESEDRRRLFDLRVRAKAETYIGNGMPAGLAWPRAYRALKETFDSGWGRRMLALRGVAVKHRKRAATLATEKKLVASLPASPRATLNELRQLFKCSKRGLSR